MRSSILSQEEFDLKVQEGVAIAAESILSQSLTEDLKKKNLRKLLMKHSELKAVKKEFSKVLVPVLEKCCQNLMKIGKWKMKLETIFANRFRKEILDKFNCSVLNVHGHAMQTVGWPDFYVAHASLGSFWIEFKIYPNKPTKKQYQRIEELRSKGIPVFVITFDLRNETMLIEYGRDLVDSQCRLFIYKRRLNHLQIWDILQRKIKSAKPL